MNNIKAGDIIKRVKGKHKGMKVGDIGTVTESWSYGTGVRLKEFEGIHSFENLEVVAKAGVKEKWTHIDNYGDECFIVHEKGSSAWVSYKRYVKDSIVPVNSLEPIKPKITTKQYDACANMANHFNISIREFDEYMSQFDIS